MGVNLGPNKQFTPFIYKRGLPFVHFATFHSSRSAINFAILASVNNFYILQSPNFNPFQFTDCPRKYDFVHFLTRKRIIMSDYSSTLPKYPSKATNRSSRNDLRKNFSNGYHSTSRRQKPLPRHLSHSAIPHRVGADQKLLREALG